MNAAHRLALILLVVAASLSVSSVPHVVTP